MTAYTLEFGFPRLSSRGSEERARYIFPATIARTVREKMAKWQNEMRRDSVVGKKWKLMGRSQDEMVCREMTGG